MEVFATFNIYNSTGHRVAEGHKASFCLEDNQCMPDIQPRYACANFGDQGNNILVCLFANPFWDISIEIEIEIDTVKLEKRSSDNCNSISSY